MLHRLPLSDQIHLVLQNDDIFRVDSDDLERGEMLAGLGLRTRFVASNKEEGAVHCICQSCPAAEERDVLTAAPVSMVAIRISWPGQSTKETCLQHGMSGCGPPSGSQNASRGILAGSPHQGHPPITSRSLTLRV